MIEYKQDRIKKLYNFIGCEFSNDLVTELTLEVMREAEAKLEQIHKQYYYPCLADVCNEYPPHCNPISATVEQRLIAMSIVKGW